MPTPGNPPQGWGPRREAGEGRPAPQNPDATTAIPTPRQKDPDTTEKLNTPEEEERKRRGGGLSAQDLLRREGRR
jgi:hypothetical protein